MDKELRKLYFSELEKEINELINPETKLLDPRFSKVINCPLCNTDINHHQMLFIKRGYTFVRCNECEMIFVNPQVNTNLLNEMYNTSKSGEIWAQIQKSEKEKSWKRKYFSDCVELIATAVDFDGLRLVDIGCSTGYFLEIARAMKKNWVLKGLEIGQTAYTECIKKGLNVEKALLDQLDKLVQFHVFTVFGVLEHVPNPIKFLNDIKAHTFDTSYICVIVPNAYSLYHMFLQNKSLGIDGRNHLLYFSEKTLRRLFNDNGFEILSLDTVLTGFDNIMRQMQWFDPNSDEETTRFVPEKLFRFLNDKKQAVNNFIHENNLGLRLRLLARFKKKA